MPAIKVDHLAGRTVEQKRELVTEVTESYLNICGGQRDGLSLFFRDVERENWAVGGTLVSERGKT